MARRVVSSVGGGGGYQGVSEGGRGEYGRTDGGRG